MHGLTAGEVLTEIAHGRWFGTEARIGTNPAALEVVAVPEIVDQDEVVFGYRAHCRVAGPVWSLEFQWSSPLAGAPWEWNPQHPEFESRIRPPDLYRLNIDRFLSDLDAVDWRDRPETVSAAGGSWPCGYQDSGFVDVGGVLLTPNTTSFIRYRRVVPAWPTEAPES